MSRSIRKYKGLRHNWYNGKDRQIRHQAVRAYIKEHGEDAAPVARKCHKSNHYDGWISNEDDAKDIASRRSEGYSHKRVIHRLFGK